MANHSQYLSGTNFKKINSSTLVENKLNRNSCLAPQASRLEDLLGAQAGAPPAGLGVATEALMVGVVTLGVELAALAPVIAAAAVEAVAGEIEGGEVEEPPPPELERLAAIPAPTLILPQHQLLSSLAAGEEPIPDPGVGHGVGLEALATAVAAAEAGHLNLLP